MYKSNSFINKKVNKLLSPLLKLLCSVGITPNQVSATGFIIGTISVIFVLLQKIEIALILLFISLIFDSIDGALARYTKSESRLGEKLELIFDRTNETMWFLALAMIDLVSLKIAILAIIAILLMSTLRNKSNFDPGFKRTILFIGYFINNFQLAIEVIFLVNLIGFVISMLILDYKYQKQADVKNVKI